MIKSSWNEIPRLIPERGYHGLATLDGEMYIVGGVTTSRAEGREGATEMLDSGKSRRFYNINIYIQAYIHKSNPLTHSAALQTLVK